MYTIVPSSYDFIGIVALSVSMSARVSPSLIWSPTLTSHCAITPVSIVGLSLGMVTSIGTACFLQMYKTSWAAATTRSTEGSIAASSVRL